MNEANTPTTVDVQEPHGDAVAFFDWPNPAPKRRKPMEQLLAELAARNGDPVWAATHTQPTGVGRDRGFSAAAKAERRWVA